MDLVAQWIVANPEGAALLAGALVTALVQAAKKLVPAWFPAGEAQWPKILTATVLSGLVNWAKAYVSGQPFSAMDALITLAASTLAHSVALRSAASKTAGAVPDEADGP
jgi:hypothetical protein